MMPLVAARMTSPRTSSMTAAPRMIRASGVLDLPRSCITRAVIPTLVAVRVAPMKTWTYPLASGSSRAPVPQPRAKGTATPMTATREEESPTLAISLRVDSRPT
jgi:hypothetical protein